MTSFICGLTRLADSDSSDERRVPRLLFMGNVFQFGLNRHGGAVVKLLTAAQTLHFPGDNKIVEQEQRGG